MPIKQRYVIKRKLLASQRGLPQYFAAYGRWTYYPQHARVFLSVEEAKQAINHWSESYRHRMQVVTLDEPEVVVA